ncbi:MAG: hypothetical protein PHP69_06180 [Candidatus Omnitrophica bacterium]|nr:hypothetical protein [Candidatus Omnitrophota bacterium]
MKKRFSKKLKWVKLRIMQIKLNPEQAVLSCCNVLERGQVVMGFGTQCSSSHCAMNPVALISS